MLKYVAIGFGVGATFLLLLSAKRPPLSKNGVGIVRFLMNLGYSKANASGIAGNIYVESKYDPKAIGDNGTSFGLAQWHKSRWESLKKWSNERGLDVNKFETQLKFIDWELNNTEKKAKRELNWKPKTNFAKGIRLTLNWYFKNKLYYKSLSKKDIVKRLGN